MTSAGCTPCGTRSTRSTTACPVFHTAIWFPPSPVTCAASTVDTILDTSIVAPWRKTVTHAAALSIVTRTCVRPVSARVGPPGAAGVDAEDDDPVDDAGSPAAAAVDALVEDPGVAFACEPLSHAVTVSASAHSTKIATRSRVDPRSTCPSSPRPPASLPVSGISASLRGAASGAALERFDELGAERGQVVGLAARDQDVR